jgi:hypothetical protein
MKRVGMGSGSHLIPLPIHKFSIVRLPSGWWDMGCVNGIRLVLIKANQIRNSKIDRLRYISNSKFDRLA